MQGPSGDTMIFEIFAISISDSPAGSFLPPVNEEVNQ
jgi:hypothetical protein